MHFTAFRRSFERGIKGRYFTVKMGQKTRIPKKQDKHLTFWFFYARMFRWF